MEKEAEKHWHAERSIDKPVNLAAMCYLCMASGMSGHEGLAFTLLEDIRDMAMRMRLFGIRATEDDVASFHRLPEDKFKEVAAAAWGAYGWLTYVWFHSRVVPLSWLTGSGFTVHTFLPSHWSFHQLYQFLAMQIGSVAACCGRANIYLSTWEPPRQIYASSGPLSRR